MRIATEDLRREVTREKGEALKDTIRTEAIRTTEMPLARVVSLQTGIDSNTEMRPVSGCYAITNLDSLSEVSSFARYGQRKLCV